TVSVVLTPGEYFFHHFLQCFHSVVATNGRNGPPSAMITRPAIAMADLVSLDNFSCPSRCSDNVVGRDNDQAVCCLFIGAAECGSERRLWTYPVHQFLIDRKYRELAIVNVIEFDWWQYRATGDRCAVLAVELSVCRCWCCEETHSDRGRLEKGFH